MYIYPMILPMLKELIVNKATVQKVFRKFGDEYISKYNLSEEQWKTFNSIVNCKTKELGFRQIKCVDCNDVVREVNSCRNRHCPMCQNYAREKWINNQTSYFLDITYFHLVATIPSELNLIALYNQKEIYNIMFKANAEAIQTLTKDKKWLGAKVGISSILHTWGNKLNYHPHIHSIITGGGIKNGKWISSKDNYLFQVKVFSSLFRGKFLYYLKKEALTFPAELKYLEDPKLFNSFLTSLYSKKWISHITSSNNNPEKIVEYIGRYAFRVAISNFRIKNISDSHVSFEYKDNKNGGKIKIMKLKGIEFIRRFLMHVLPKQFMKIKHYGILSNRNKKIKIKFCRYLIGQIVDIVQTKSLAFTCKHCNGCSFEYNYYYSFKDLLRRRL